MKRVLLTLAAGLALTAQAVRADDPPAAVPVTAPSEAPATVPEVVPGVGFPAARYETLWTKSPFAVATSEVVQDTSLDYSMVGIAQIDGISYASLIETKTPQEHFLISSDKPVRGLTLTSITHSHDGSDTFAIVQKDGQSITLKLEQPPASMVPGAPPPNAPPMPGVMTPQILMPGSGVPSPTGSTRPMPPRFHRSPIHLPPPPVQQSQPAPAQPSPAPPR